MLKRLPYIVSDIDGVLVRGRVPIPRTKEALERVSRMGLPFCCLTNGGGSTEQVKADKLNAIFKDLPAGYFTSRNMILNHTPLKEEFIAESKNGLLLISGSMDIIGIAEDLRIKNFITADELNVLIHSQQPKQLQVEILPADTPPLKEIVSRINKRMNGLTTLDPNDLMQQIQAIFVLNDVSPYESSLHVFLTLINDRIKKNLPIPKYYTSQNDILWASAFPLMRMAFGPFNYLMADLCSKYLNHNHEMVIYGKPTLKTFKFVEQYMKKMYPDGGNFYMIGDNPKADIKGANNIGWNSILTRTGVFKGEGNDPEDPATVVVADFHEAIERILERENLTPQ